jgi:S1-C subfamily serine protease
MIQHIITLTDRNNWQRKLKRYSVRYNWFYIGTLVVAFCISILPFSMHWVSSAYTEPREAVVKIQSDKSMGTGFLVSSTYIITARHVVEDLSIGKTVTVLFEQAKIPFETRAEIVYYKKFSKDIKNLNDALSYFNDDVALLRLNEEIKSISPLELGNSDELKAGNVLIMGYGLDDWSEPDGKVTSNSFHDNKALFKLDGSINPGHSGGPVMLLEDDKPTKVIGIVVGGSSHLVKGEDIALKINQAERILSIGGYSDIRIQ